MPDFSRFLRRGCALVLALLASTLAFSALAQTDPPGRIGRIAWLTGDVFLNNPDTGESSAAPLNHPLTSGDIITTASGARAEIQVGAMTIRVDSGSRIEFDRIDDEHVRVLLNDGRIIAKLPTDDSKVNFTLETSQGRFIPRDTGIYRFDSDRGNASATSYFGSLRFEGRDIALDINAGESARIWTDSAGQPNYRMAQGVRDEFTQWSAARDQQRPRASVASRYVSPEMTGAQDLDAYGDWSEYPEYGAVWFPRAVAADWAPYRTGHWAWVAPWGWTWIGHEPWGFAPFHYGRWVSIHGNWAWVPGSRIARPVYAPALVAWTGTPGVSVSLSIGHAPPIGWFPLAPREVYVPFYRSSHTHVRYVNAPHVPHIRNIDDIVARPHEVMRSTQFIHRDEPRAFSAAPADAFRHRRPDVRIAPRRDRPEFQGSEVFRPPSPPRSEAAGPQRQQFEVRREIEQPRARREAPVRQATPPTMQRVESQATHPQAVPPALREPRQEKPREFQRPPEVRHETRVETRREERVQQPRQPREERHQERRETRDDRRERGRPGDAERR